MLKYIALLFSFFLYFISNLYCQNDAEHPAKRPHDWWQADMKNDSLPGISLNEAYRYLKGRKSTSVIVAIIDNCVDTAHEELRDRIWINTKEIPNNGIDDDHNGYIDDIHGWCFIANKYNIVQTKQSSLETLVYMAWKQHFEHIDSAQLSNGERPQYDMYTTAKKLLFDRCQLILTANILHRDSVKFVQYVDKLIFNYGDKRLNEIPYRLVPFSNSYDSTANSFFDSFVNVFPATAILRKYDSLLHHDTSAYNFTFNLIGSFEKNKYDTLNNYRKIIGDDPDNFSDKTYGTPSINLPEIGGEHATHIAGIIAASRANNIGIKGISDKVIIMPLITSVPNGLSISKDIVMAIHYAVDNGAFIINMSFGNTPWLDEHEKELRKAFDYAYAHNVLIVNGAGNDGLSLDNEKYLLGMGSDGKEHENFIRVGSTTALMNGGLLSSFSQVGGKTVDIFAPGSAIYSTTPGNNYQSYSGTSMACPVVAGVAALLKSYFPKLTAIQIKNILMNSVYKPDMLVTPPFRSSSKTKVPFYTLSKSGGIVNAYSAVKLADKMLKGK